MKQKVFSMLALLLMAATGAKAETVTWTASDMTDLFIDFEEGLAAHNTIKGITVTASSGGNGAWQGNNISMDEGSTTITFTSSVGNIKSIAITAQSIYSYGDTPSGWTMPDYKNLSWSGDASPTVSMTLSDWSEFSNISEIVFTIESSPATGYSVTLPEGTEDAENWTISDGTNSAQGNVGLKGLSGGETVTITYNGEKRVKSVKAVEKALDPAKAYLTWDADQNMLVATEIPTTAIKVENANENVSWAGTYVVEDDVTISGTIGLSGDVDLIIKDGATLTAQGIGGSGNNLRIYGQANQSGQLVVNRTNGDAIMNIKTLEVHSAQLTATSSTNSCGGIYGTTTFNVYGGLVDAKGTGAGYGINLNSGGSINIHGGEVKAEGKGTSNYSYGIRSANTATVTVNGGKLWAENADKKALNNVNLQKGTGFTGKIEYSSDKSTWSETVDADAKYVRAGY